MKRILPCIYTSLLLATLIGCASLPASRTEVAPTAIRITVLPSVVTTVAPANTSILSSDATQTSLLSQASLTTQDANAVAQLIQAAEEKTFGTANYHITLLSYGGTKIHKRLDRKAMFAINQGDFELHIEGTETLMGYGTEFRHIGTFTYARGPIHARNITDTNWYILDAVPSILFGEKVKLLPIVQSQSVDLSRFQESKIQLHGLSCAQFTGQSNPRTKSWSNATPPTIDNPELTFVVCTDGYIHFEAIRGLDARGLLLDEEMEVFDFGQILAIEAPQEAFPLNQP